MDTSITLRDVQAVLLSMFSADTILIGHSLESDLLALKVIHSTVVDTAVLFPHRLGLPYKRSLRNLMADYLRQIIQDNGERRPARPAPCPTRPAHPPALTLALALALSRSGWAQLQRGCQRLHAPGDLEDSGGRQDQAMTPPPRPPRTAPSSPRPLPKQCNKSES